MSKTCQQPDLVVLAKRARSERQPGMGRTSRACKPLSWSEG